MLARVTLRETARTSSETDIATQARAARIVITDDAELRCRSDQVDVVVEGIGAIEHGARVALTAIDAGKHVVLMNNAELDSTLGLLLKHNADAAGVIVTNADDDQPGVLGNLHRFVAGMGVARRGIHGPTLERGTVIDGIGGYLTDEECENADTAAAQDLLPMVVAESCTLARDVARDATLTYADVRLPPDRLVDWLRLEQRR